MIAAMRRQSNRKLAPLEPDAFLRWAWMNGPRDKGTSPLTIEDLHFEYGGEIARAALRRMYVHLAALVRRNQRLGLDPMDGVR